MGLNQYQYLWLKSPSAVVTFPSFFRYEFADRFQLCSLRFLMMVIIYVFAPCLFSGRWIQPGAFPGRFSGAEIGPFWWWGKHPIQSMAVLAVFTSRDLEELPKTSGETPWKNHWSVDVWLQHGPTIGPAGSPPSFGLNPGWFPVLGSTQGDKRPPRFVTSRRNHKSSNLRQCWGWIRLYF